MPLVDYASSDEDSENDSEVNEKEEVNKTEGNKPKPVEENEKASSVTNNDNNGELFSSLPKPRKVFSVFEDDNKLSKLLLNKNSLPINKKESVKISVPSVSDFEDDTQQPAPKKIKPSSKSVGLFSVLPPPKNNTVKQVKRNLVPHAVSKIQPKKNYFKSDTKSTTVKDTDGDEDEDDALVGSSFFGSSLAQENTLSDSGFLSTENRVFEGTNSNYEAPENSFISNIPTPVQNSNADLNVNEDNLNYVDPSQTTTTEAVSANDNPLDLDEKALQILCGNKKKRHQMPMNIIDLSGEEVLPDSKEWLLKQFTEEKRGRGHSHKKTHGPSSMSRRKHQITYLAYQAKEQELELQNQWAANRMSRKQTQSKYGF